MRSELSLFVLLYHRKDN